MNKLDALLKEYERLQKLNLHLDMTRGRPCKEQLDLSLPMMDVLSSDSDYLDEAGIDVRNYGGLEGIPECKRLMAEVIGVDKDNVLIFGNSSLNAMYDQIARSYTHGVCGETPWVKLNKVKWLCPTPGYDRHFAITEHFEIEMISVPMNEDGPDMDLVEELIQDESVKGIWCVPKYSNPTGITYSAEVVKRMANLRPKARDFRIYWDNAYALHHVGNNDDELLNIFEEAKKVNNEDIVYIFSSTSKISFPGSGVACLGASRRNLDDIVSQLKYQTIGYDKVNELRHVRYFKDLNGLKSQMDKHSKILEKKFNIVDEYLSKEVSDIASWNKPHGGYFVTLVVNGVAKEVVARCKECGVKLTEAGATHPYHHDPSNSYIRLAPTAVNESDLRKAMEVLTLAIKIETLLKK